jgi:hypothetical protein
VSRRRWLCALAIVAAGCGKKGPPLPPLTRIPSPPTEVTAIRRGGSVAVQLKVPSTNIDEASPGNVSEVEVYALDGPDTTEPEAVVRQGTHVGSVKVNEPIDPDASQEEADRIRAAQPKDAVDQGAVARVVDELQGTTAPEGGSVRSYVAVAVNERGRKGAASTKAIVPLGTPPPAPPAPSVSYDESGVTIDWSAGAANDVTYFVSRVDGEETVLTPDGTSDVTFVESSIVWDEQRCYVVRAQTTVGELPIQSEASPRACVTLTDTFPPAAPTGLQTIAAEGAISLIWDPSAAPDLAGYLVLRAVAPQTTPEVVTPAPIADTTYRDTVPAGARVTYSVVAVDRAGNRSPASATAEETAR